MGVQVRIVLFAPDEAHASAAAGAAFDRFAELDDALSDYRLHSELNRLCAAAGGPPVKVSRDLFTVLSAAQDLARRTDGAFDVTVGPMVAVWRKARKAQALPAADAIAGARSLVGWRKMTLDRRRRTVRLSVPGMKLDLGGIAKGYAGDCAQAVLRRHGIASALVEAGGDIVVSDPPPGAAGWQIEIPDPEPSGRVRTILAARQGVSTSGDTEQFLQVGGTRYSHIMDPATGLGLTTRIAVTVVAPNGLASDGLSTALSVLGPERGEAYVRGLLGVRAYIRRAVD
jgi:FAD:protein FMN transferase